MRDCSHFHRNWKLFLPRFLKHYSIHSKRKRRINTLLKHRFFFAPESGWKRPGDTCDILLCNLMRYWQPLGYRGDKGGKRAYIERLARDLGERKPSGNQTGWRKQREHREDCTRSTCLLWVYTYLPLTIFHESYSAGSCKFKHHQKPWRSAWPGDPIEVAICHCSRAPGSCFWIAKTLYAIMGKQNFIYYLKLLGEIFYDYLWAKIVLSPSPITSSLLFFFLFFDPKKIRNLDGTL